MMMAKVKRTTPTPTDRETREQEKRAKLYAQGERSKARELAAAGVAYDSRIASGRREFEIQNLGGSKRARQNPYKKLFKNPNEATYERILACEKFDLLWHMSQADQMPAPRFEPRVDSSTLPGVAIGNADAHKQLDALRHRIGDEAVAMMVARVVVGFSYRAMEAEGHGDERGLSVLFVSAVDGVARFLGLKEQSRLVETMRRAIRS